jgi:quercetin dioxygenase-like cupin family protein
VPDVQIVKLIATTATSLSLLAWGVTHPAQAGVAAKSGVPATASIQDTQRTIVTRNGSRPSQRGPAESFTGSARIDPLFDATESSRAAGASVTFEPGARTAWHTHPRGQTLIVTEGSGRVQRWGGPVDEIRPGDVVRIPPGVKHWHGAAPTTAMTHIAIQEHLNGKVVDWLEKVSEAQYGALPRTSR